MKRAAMQVASLWLRDLRHFLRQRSRVVGAVGQPFVLWVFLSAGFRGMGGVSGGYGDFLFPGVIVLIALFAGVFSTISVIEDRRAGFLQGVLAAPVPPAAIVGAKLLTGATLSLAQAAIFLLLLPFTGIALTGTAVAASAGALLVVAAGFTAAGLLLAWRMKSTQGFHAIMNLGLIPLWLLSGAFFPADTAAGWLGIVVRFNPVHYATSFFARAFSAGAPAVPPGLAPLSLSCGVTLAGTAALWFLCVRTVRAR